MPKFNFNIIDNRRTDPYARLQPPPAPPVQTPLGNGPIQTGLHPDRRIPVGGRGSAVRILGGPIGKRTFEGGAGYQRDSKSDLFMLAVTHLVDDTFYESAEARNARLRALVSDAALSDPAWTAELIRWMRSEGNMRSASIIAAAAYAYTLGTALADPRFAAPTGAATVRRVVDSVCQRADEPGEFIAYWHATYGRKIPVRVKRGLADAVIRLYTPYAVLKYDTASHAYRFGDVLELVQPRARLAGQPGKVRAAHALSYLIDRRHGGTPKWEVPPMLTVNARLRTLADENPVWLKNPSLLRDAGMTWEDVLSLVGDRLPKKEVWESIIPSMGLMALARNLRNFDEAGISEKTAAEIALRFSDPDQVAKSRMFPYRWYAAYKAAESIRWSDALGRALKTSTRNIPELPGRTLILIDTSASMRREMSGKSKIQLWEAAAVFAYSLAARQPFGHVGVYGFADHAFRLPASYGATPLQGVAAVEASIGYAGHGTRIAESIRQAWAEAEMPYDRVFVFTDMQTSGAGISTSVPADVPLYGFNLMGYAASGLDTTRPNRVELGGLSDGTFKMIPMLERGADAGWPWEQA